MHSQLLHGQGHTGTRKCCMGKGTHPLIAAQAMAAISQVYHRPHSAPVSHHRELHNLVRRNCQLAKIAHCAQAHKKQAVWWEQVAQVWACNLEKLTLVCLLPCISQPLTLLDMIPFGLLDMIPMHVQATDQALPLHSLSPPCFVQAWQAHT